MLGLAGLLSVVVISADMPTSPLVAVGVVAAGVAAVLSMLAILPRAADDLDPTGMIEDLSLSDEEEVRVQLAATQAALYAQEQGQVARKADSVRRATWALFVSVTALVVSSIIGPELQEVAVAWVRSTVLALA